jgi:hypothetical protein
MHGEIDFPPQQGLFYFFGKDPLATHRLNSRIRKSIAARFDHDELDQPFRIVILDLLFNPTRLCQSQSAAAGSNPDTRHGIISPLP